MTTPTIDATGLVARTIPLDHVPDLVREAGSDGLLWRQEHAGLAGQGEAVRIELPGGLADPASVAGVRQVLAAIEVDDEVGLPGCGPVAMGALAFDRDAAGSLVVPQRIVGYRDGQGWETTIGSAERLERSEPVGEPPDQFTLTSARPHAEWRAVVQAAVDRIRAGQLRKVVLARRTDLEANRPFVIPDVLGRLVALYPSCMIYSVGGFVGASPELLIERGGDRVSSHPLAGTVARSGDTAADEALVAGLLNSAKQRREHALVIEGLAAALGPVCATLDVPEQPAVLGLRNVSHLATHLSGVLSSADPPTAFELAARVHPTPAVGGTPTDEAVAYLRQVEGFDRGCYGGPVGWVDARGDGAWAIAIRCAQLDGTRAALFAGVGIVDGSDPDSELAETQLKLQALLAATVRP